MVLSRSVVDEVGLLDETLFLGHDDLELSWRLKQHNYRLLVATDTFVHHEGHVSFKTEALTKTTKLLQESADRLYAKLEAHYGEGNVPTPMELWGIDWFKPTQACLRSKFQMAEQTLTSIIVLTFNGLDHTKQCLASIEMHTPQPYELIIVDNGSTDGTRDYLRDYMASHNNVRVITNATNPGFAAGNNQGLRLSSGEYLLLINNDTIVTEGWLDGLLRAINLSPEVGLSGPKSNYVVSSLQKVEEVNYKSKEELQIFAREFAAKNKNSYLQTTEKLVGFCLLIKRAVINKIGLLDETFGIGNFEDDDYCLRARLAGFEFVVAGDVFIHHEGNCTFKANQIDYEDQIEKNLNLFKKKWRDEIEFRGVEYFLKRDLHVLAKNEIERGEDAYNANYLGKARENFEKVLEWEPDSPEALNNLGVLLWESGDESRAVNYFMDALEKDPNHLGAIENLLQIVSNIKLPDEAAERFAQICETRGLVVEE